MIIRPVVMSDLSALRAIAVESGPGFTSLVDNHDFLVEKIARSEASFASAGRGSGWQPGDQSYLFVLVAPDSGDIMGITGIEASVGQRRPIYHFRVEKTVRQSARLGLNRHQQTLTLGNHCTGCSEICTLFLRPRYRRAWAGKLLSRIRFLFMAQHPHRFASTVIAQMRGVSDNTGNSPFWHWFQANFVDLDFATVNQLMGTGDNGFVAELMPEHPIYTHLLDQSARAVIGKVHSDTRPALHLLESEGFRYTGLIDPIDGGPTLEAQTDRLRSVQQTRCCRVHISAEPSPAVAAWTHGGQGKTLMVANTSTSDFRATVTRAARHLPAHQILEIPRSLAHTLGLDSGADAWFADLDIARNQSQHPALSANSESTPVKEASSAY